nr:retrovirus-related Pol polyprotein from transposon TNT 1-94 [Tanacetum cinerariifolium]
MQQPMTNPKDITDPTAAMSMALVLMAKAFKLNYSTPTNNNQRISSNLQNRQIAQSAWAKGNAIGNNGNTLLIAQKEEVGIQIQAKKFDLMVVAADLDEIEESDKAPAYDSDESAEKNFATKVEKVNSINRKLRETSSNLTIELARYKNKEKYFEISQEKHDKLERCYQQFVYQEQCLTKKISALHLRSEVVNTAFYVQNRVLVVKPHNKTPYELFHGRTPTLSFMRPFGCPVTILDTKDHLGKFNGKADKGFFIGCSLNSNAFKVFNSRTRTVEENLHIRFSENTPNVVGTKSSDNASQARKKTEPVKYYILLPLWTVDPPFSQDPKSSHYHGSKPSSDDGKKDKDDNAVADINNLDTTIQVSPTLTTRIHKDHPLDQVIRDLYSTTQTRQMSKNLEEHGFFWSTAMAKTINGEVKIQAWVDGKEISITESSVRGDLRLADEEGVDCFPNSTIFENLELMGVGKGFSCRITNLFPCMLVQNAMGEGSTLPTDSQHIPTILQSSSSQPQKTQKLRKPKRKNARVPQPSGSTENVADEAVYKELNDRSIRAATTASSLEEEQDSGNIDKTQSKATPNEASSPGTTLGGRPRCQDTMGYTIAQSRFENVSKLSHDSLLAR